MRRRRNSPLTRSEKRALMAVLMKHNPRRSRKRKLSKAARRRIALRNLRKARRPAKRSLRSYRALKRWASNQIGKHQTGQRGYVIVKRFGIRRRRGSKVKLPGLAWSGKKGTVAFRGAHHDPDFYNGSYEEFDTMFTNPKRIVRRGGKRYVVITNRKGRKVASFRIKARSHKRRVPARLRKYLFKAGSVRLKRALVKARAGWRRWRMKKLAERRASGRKVRRVRRIRRVVRRHHKRFVFTAARRRALAKARRARR